MTVATIAGTESVEGYGTLPYLDKTYNELTEDGSSCLILQEEFGKSVNYLLGFMPNNTSYEDYPYYLLMGEIRCYSASADGKVYIIDDPI